MRRHAFAGHLILFLALCAALLAAWPRAGEARAPGAQRNFVTIGTGGINGVYFRVGTEICRHVNRGWREHGVRCAAEATAGSVANLKGVQRGRLPLALVQKIDVADLPEDEAPRLIAPLYHEALVLLAAPGVVIEGFDDLRGLRASIGPAGSGHRSALEAVLAVRGWAPADIGRLGDLPPAAALEQLCTGSLDVVALMVGHPSAMVASALARCELAFARVSAGELADSAARVPRLEIGEIPAGSYGDRPATPALTSGVLLVTGAHLPDRVARAVLAALAEGLPDMRRDVPALAGMETAALYREVPGLRLHRAVESIVTEQR